MMGASIIGQVVKRPRCPILCNPTVPTPRRLVSSSSEIASAARTESTAAPQPRRRLLLLVSRSSLELQKQQYPTVSSHSNTKKPSASSADEKPWPRNVVWAFYAACGVIVPYTCAWFLASQESWRSQLLLGNEQEDDSGNNNVQRTILQWMRNHFGEVDELALSEPERVALSMQPGGGGLQQQQKQQQPLPHKFVDEPTAAVRRRQAQIDQQHDSPNAKVTVRLFSNSDDDDYVSADDTRQVSLPASTRANPEAVRRALQEQAQIQLPESAPVALDFPVSEPELESDENPIGSEHTSQRQKNPISAMSIYSLWHHHPAPPTATATTRMSEIEIHLSRLDHEIAALQRELQSSSSSSRAIDDIQNDLRLKQSERRRWRRKQWLGL